MKCPRCAADNYSKNGFHRGKQKYICKCCGRQWLETTADRGYPQSVRALCVKMYRNGLRIKEISRYTEIGYSTIMNWVKQEKSFCELLLDTSEAQENTEVDQSHGVIT